jgi:hypothetical protein
MPIIIDQFEFDALDDDLKALLSVSDQLRTEEQMAREIILNAIDPIIALGDPFRFERREPDDFYISIDVPGPCDQVDLAEALEVLQAITSYPADGNWIWGRGTAVAFTGWAWPCVSVG